MPFGVDLTAQCLRVAETSCRTGSRQVISLESDPVCSDLLIFGPTNPLPECPFIFDAINEFNWSVREFCSQDLFANPPSGEN